MSEKRKKCKKFDSKRTPPLYHLNEQRDLKAYKYVVYGHVQCTWWEYDSLLCPLIHRLRPHFNFSKFQVFILPSADLRTTTLKPPVLTCSEPLSFMRMWSVPSRPGHTWSQKGVKFGQKADWPVDWTLTHNDFNLNSTSQTTVIELYLRMVSYIRMLFLFCPYEHLECWPLWIFFWFVKVKNATDAEQMSLAHQCILLMCGMLQH